MLKLFKDNFAPWRAQFGIEMDFTPVIGCQDVVDYHKHSSPKCPDLLGKDNELKTASGKPFFISILLWLLDKRCSPLLVLQT